MTWPLVIMTSSRPSIGDVGHGDAEAQQVARRQPDAGGRAAVGEEALAQVVVERGSLAVEVGDHQVGPAVAVQVAAGHAHSRLVSALSTAGHAGLEADLLEVKAALVAEEVIGRAVVGDEEVDAVVAVEVGGDDAQARARPSRRSPSSR